MNDWRSLRQLWVKQNPPTHEGYYTCGICGSWVKSDEMQLDHIKPRSGGSANRLSNLQPSHGVCNMRKGSKRWEPKIPPEEYEIHKKLNL